MLLYMRNIIFNRAFTVLYTFHIHISVFLGMFDKDRNGTITFQEFGALWKYVTDWQQCFRGFDRDGSGSIDKNELKQALTSFGNSY